MPTLIASISVHFNLFRFGLTYVSLKWTLFISHKAVAIAAGIGWAGKKASWLLLSEKKYGSVVNYQVNAHWKTGWIYSNCLFAGGQRSALLRHLLGMSDL